MGLLRFYANLNASLAESNVGQWELEGGLGEEKRGNGEVWRSYPINVEMNRLTRIIGAFERTGGVLFLVHLVSE